MALQSRQKEDSKGEECMDEISRGVAGLNFNRMTPTLPMELITQVLLLLLSSGDIRYRTMWRAKLQLYSCLRLVSHDFLDLVASARFARQPQSVATAWVQLVADELLRIWTVDGAQAVLEIRNSLALRTARHLILDVQSQAIGTAALLHLTAGCSEMVALEIIDLQPSVAMQLDFSRLHTLALSFRMDRTPPPTLDLAKMLNLRLLALTHPSGGTVRGQAAAAVRLPAALEQLELYFWPEIGAVDASLATRTRSVRIQAAEEGYGDASWAAIRRLLCDMRLTQLEVRNQDEEDVVEHLEVHGSDTLEALRLSSNRLSSNGICDPGLMQLDGLKCLTYLSLSRNPLRTILFLDLRLNLTLRHLDLGGVNSTCWREDLPKLADQLRANRTLKVLVLADCALTDDDLVGFEVGCSPGLLQLDLSGNRFGDAGVLSLKLEEKDHCEVWIGGLALLLSPTTISQELLDSLCTPTRRIHRGQRDAPLQYQLRFSEDWEFI